MIISNRIQVIGLICIIILLFITFAFFYFIEPLTERIKYYKKIKKANKTITNLKKELIDLFSDKNFEDYFVSIINDENRSWVEEEIIKNIFANQHLENNDNFINRVICRNDIKSLLMNNTLKVYGSKYFYHKDVMLFEITDDDNLKYFISKFHLSNPTLPFYEETLKTKCILEFITSNNMEDEYIDLCLDKMRTTYSPLFTSKEKFEIQKEVFVSLYKKVIKEHKEKFLKEDIT